MFTHKFSFLTPEEVPVSIEGELTCKDAETRRNNSVILLHPHPLMGGNMHFKLLHRLARILYEQNFDVLRFNFRGVGKSGGNFGSGILEGFDLLGAYAHLTDEGYKNIFVAAYSFGSVVGLSQLKNLRIPAFAAVGFPTFEKSLVELAHSKQAIKIPTLFASGENDEYSNLDNLQSLLKFENQPEILVIPDEDHFFETNWQLLCEAVSNFFGKNLPEL